MRALYPQLCHGAVLHIDGADGFHILQCQRYGGIKANRWGLTAGRRGGIGEVARKKDKISEPPWNARFGFVRPRRIPVFLKTVLGRDQNTF